MAPRFKPFKTNGNVPTHYFFLNDKFSNPLVLNSLNVANVYIFKCVRDSKVENGGRIPGFLDELGPFRGITKKSPNVGLLL